MTESSGHDELCPTDQNLPDLDQPCWFCDLIARARADEQERRPDWLELTLALDEAKAERDAARAEVEEIRATLRAESRLCAEARAEVAALREEVAHAWAVANGEARR